MKFLVLGAGGVGGYFGGRLAASGADVTFLVRERRAAELARNGLAIESPLGDLRMPVRTVDAAALGQGYGCILLTCKAYDLDGAMDAIAPAVGADCAILPMLNGIEHLDRLDARFGPGHVLGGSCHIAATLLPGGTVKHLNDLHRIMYGERDGARSDRILAISAALEKSGVEAKLSDDILLEMWEKVSLLATLAGMTCLMRASVGEIVAAPDGAALMARCYGTCSEIAAAVGHRPRDHVAKRMAAVCTAAGSTLTASMLRDLEAGGPVEADHIVGYMLRKARELSIDAALLTIAYTHLKAYENRRAAGRLPGVKLQ